MRRLTTLGLGFLMVLPGGLLGGAGSESSRLAAELGFGTVNRDDAQRIVYAGGMTRLSATSVSDVERLFTSDLGRMYGLGAGNEMRAESARRADGKVFYRLAQRYNGLPVIGGELVVQTSATGRLEAILGHVKVGLRIDTGLGLPFEDVIGSAVAGFLGGDPESIRTAQYDLITEPRLVVYAVGDERPVLAWDVSIQLTAGGRFFLERMFADARTGTLITSYTQIYEALSRKIHTADGGCLAAFGGVSLPGTLVMNEGGSSSDTAAQGAYDNTGNSYWFYRHMFNRDSYDGNGIQLVSTAHVTFSSDGFLPTNCSPNNAAYLGSPYNQMVYGDGDGQVLKSTSLSLDVTAHELTHGVTDSTSKLAYQKESGAMNESLSDIFGSGAEAWVQSLRAEGKRPQDGNPATYRTFRETWLLGDDVAGPQIGEALRYMNNPTKDGRSADYYPERNYAGSCSPSQSNDQCGVHTNSGISNLAFYLMVEGGSHPRNKTSVVVTGIGIEKALRIFYQTETQLLSQNSTFQDMRFATAQAATNLYGNNSCEYVTVMKAWDAVGVGGSWTDPGTCGGGGGTNQPPVASFTATTSGLTASFNASGSSDSDGSIASYAWNFGDGATGSGVTQSHTYAAMGTYNVTLTVTDNGGLTASKSSSVTVSQTGGGGSEVEPNNTRSSANTLPNATATTGYVSSFTDVDYFKITIGPRKTAAISLLVPAGLDYDLYLYNSSGYLIAWSENDTGIAESINYKNTSYTSNRTVYIKVLGYLGASSTTSSYTVKATW